MPDYTKKNVSELKDSAPEFGVGEIQEARFPADALDAEDTGFGHQRLKPNKRQGFGHQHEQAEEVYFVIAGSGRVRLDDEMVELSKDDFLRVAPQVKRRFEAGADGLEYVVFGTRHEGDGEVDTGFWAPDADEG
ncbi:MAG: cupin domain-containing protein [Actinomycetota bacterium]|nr:cupin domain-containing protein [Actinomycetota bacterium]